MKKLTTSKAMLYVAYGMVKDLFVGACFWGTSIYFLLMMLNYNIPYSRCFASVVLLRSLYMGIMSYLKRDEISEALEKAVEEYNKKV